MEEEVDFTWPENLMYCKAEIRKHDNEDLEATVWFQITRTPHCPDGVKGLFLAQQWLFRPEDHVQLHHQIVQLAMVKVREKMKILSFLFD